MIMKNEPKRDGSSLPEDGMIRQKLDPKAMNRIFSYMKSDRKQLVVIVVCIFLSALASAASSLFLQTLIDDYIVPLLAMDTPLFTGLIRALCSIGIIYLIGVVSSLLYNRLSVTIAQRTLKKIRDEMFSGMQWLPVRYFDTHTHGEIMSLYTNDTDTLRQLIAQALPQLISSVFTIVAVFFAMLYVSIPLTVIGVAVILIILRLTGKIVSKIGVFFIEQQRTLAELNGYVEEMIGGQKVIKVFNHEEQSKKELREKNHAWEKSASLANGNANAIMPMMNAMSYMQYVVVAVIGAAMAIAGITNPGLTGINTMTLGMLASFLTLTRNFMNPISQISNQFNSVVTALAGASRIFAFMDEEQSTLR